MRHGRAAAGWDADPDPGLDPVGLEQADAVAARLAPLGPLPIRVSPLRRTRETAAALEATWGVTAVVDAGVGELQSPVDGLTERHAWLVAAFQKRWPDLEPGVQQWRRHVLDTFAAIDADTVVVTHFVAINAVVGAATGDDAFVCFRPDNCSVTVIDVEDGRFRVVELGAEADTVVQ